MISEQTVRELLAGVVKEEGGKVLDPSLSLKAQGLDSLDYFNLLLALQEKTGVEVPDEDVDTLVSLEAIVAYFNRKSA